jgi:hypothetical protein
MKMTTKIYITGPMRGIPNFNFPAFHEAAAALRALGYHVFSPAEFDMIFSPAIEAADGMLEAHPIHGYIRRDCHVIINELHPPEDGVALLPGWENSKGAFAEVALAKWCGLKINTVKELLENGKQAFEEDPDKAVWRYLDLT